MNRVMGSLGMLASTLVTVPRFDRAEYVLFGSTVLYLHGLRADVGDVDVFVRPRVYVELRRREPWLEQVPREGDPPFLVLDLPVTWPPVHIFYDWTTRDDWMDVQRAFALAGDVMGWRCVPLSEVLKHKLQAESSFEDPDDPKRAKHLRDIEVLTRAGVVVA